MIKSLAEAIADRYTDPDAETQDQRARRVQDTHNRAVTAAREHARAQANEQIRRQGRLLDHALAVSPRMTPPAVAGDPNTDHERTTP